MKINMAAKIKMLSANMDHKERKKFRAELIKLLPQAVDKAAKLAMADRENGEN